MARTVEIRTPEGLRRLRVRLRNPAPAARMIGILLVSESARAFTEQRLGDQTWPERYPNQAEPFVNVAAVLEKANRGVKPRPGDFSRRPALVGTRSLQRSVAAELRGPDTVEVGSASPYAAVHQYGGTSRQEVTETAKLTLRSWLYTPTGRLRKEAAPYAEKLTPLLKKTSHETEVFARPFIGVTDEAGPRITDIVEHFVAGEEVANGGA